MREPHTYYVEWADILLDTSSLLGCQSRDRAVPEVLSHRAPRLGTNRLHPFGHATLDAWSRSTRRSRLTEST